MISPFRKLGVVERQMFEKDDYSWIYYLSIGIQASIIGYMFSSFFASVAYQWYIYYPVAYAICLRRIYQIEHKTAEGPDPTNEKTLQDLTETAYFMRSHREWF